MRSFAPTAGITCVDFDSYPKGEKSLGAILAATVLATQKEKFLGGLPASRIPRSKKKDDLTKTLAMLYPKG